MNKKRNPLINLFIYSWKYSSRKGLFITFVVFCVIANSFQLLEPIVISRIFNSVQFSANDPGLFSFIAQNLILLVFITFGFWLFHGTSRLMEYKNAFLIRKNYKKEMFDKVIDLPVEWQKDHHSGDTIDRINKASHSLYQFSSHIFEIVQNLIRLFGSIIILSIFDWRIALAAVFVSVFAIWTSLKFDNKLKIGYRKVFKAENYLASAIHDYISNVITVITLRLKKRVSGEIESRSMLAFNTFNKNRKIDEFRWFIISMYTSIAISAALIFSAYTSHKARGVIAIGTLFILYRYLKNMGGFFSNFAWKYGEIVRQDTAVKMAEYINVEQKNVTLETKKYYLPKKWRTLQVKNLYFSYKKVDKKESVYNLSNISLTISQKLKIALIGESGSGKSTILSLVRGLHHPGRNNVYCDGKKLEYGLRHLNEITSLIPQDPEIFNSSVKDNITMGTRVSTADINKVLEIARFDKVVSRFKKGLRTNVLEKGVSLSGGEKQRLALARGLLMAKNYNILLLDEPTSSVDSANEIKIYQNIFKYYEDKTILSAIHRLHLLRYFDYIYYFDKGKIITEGTFNMLLRDDKFKILWDNYTKNR
ncbi:hypothetical protein DRH27_03805 [Candidatus Falkowbacteria bacterium]|nr:MAG: hypothetical protein DRH27_03805 [Candidatus Falkowbacteria bacterium]